MPFALWCAARHIDNYEEALWATVSGLGDRDTTCAIVGGVVTLATGRRAILAVRCGALWPPIGKREPRSQPATPAPPGAPPPASGPRGRDTGGGATPDVFSACSP